MGSPVCGSGIASTRYRRRIKRYRQSGWRQGAAEFYRKLLDSGKLKKIAAVAVARERLIRLNATMKRLLEQQPSPARARTT